MARRNKRGPMIGRLAQLGLLLAGCDVEPGTPDKLLALPTDVPTAPTANNVYVIDYNHNRVQMFQQPT